MIAKASSSHAEENRGFNNPLGGVNGRIGRALGGLFKN